VAEKATAAAAADGAPPGKLVSGPNLTKSARSAAVHLDAEEASAVVAASADSRAPAFNVSHFICC